MDTAYNRRIASAVDAINHRSARHAPANFVGKGYGSDSGLSTQYNDVMGAAYNHPRAMSHAEREYRAEGERKEFAGSGFFDDIGQAFRYTPVGMISDAAQGKQTVFGGQGSDGNGMHFGGQGSDGNGIGGLGGRSYAMVGTTMPFREVPMAGVMDYGSGMPKYPANKVVQVGNMDGSGRPQVGCSWYASLEDYKGGRNRMMESKKIGRMTKNPDMPTDLTEDEARFMEDLFANSPDGAGYYGGEWYNDWGDFTEAIADAYDTIKGVWEDYIKPVLDVVGTPLKDALLSSGNPYGEAGAGVLELLGYGIGGQGSDGNGMYGGSPGYGGAPGMSGGSPGYGGAPGMSGGSPGYGGRPGVSGGRPGVSGGLGGGEGVFANVKPIPANSLGFSPKLEVEQLNAATGSTSYGDMPTSNPVGSGIGGKKRRMIRKNVRGVSSAPTKMGEGYTDADGFYVTTPRDSARGDEERYTSLEGNVSSDAMKDRAKQALKDILEEGRRQAPAIVEYGRDKLLSYVGSHLPAQYAGKMELFAKMLSNSYIESWKESLRKEKRGNGIGGKKFKDDDFTAAHGDKMKPGYYETMESDGARLIGNIRKEQGGRHLESDMEDLEEYRKKEQEKRAREILGIGMGGSAAMERDGLEISGNNSMGAIVAERGFKPKAQKKAAAVVEKASNNMWNGTQMENTTGRSAKANPSLVLEGGSHPLTQTNNLQAVYGGNAVRSGLTRRGTSNAYGVMIKKVMAEKGMKLGQASKYIKENGLYKK